MNKCSFAGFIAILVLVCLTRVELSQSEDANGFSRALSQLTLQLERGLRKHDENLFVSPLGLVTAMGMVYLGAKGSTAQQIHQGLHFGQFSNTQDQVSQNLKTNVDLYRPLQPKNYTLNLANQLFLQNGFEILDEFRDDTATYYSASVQQVDFVREPSNAVDTINNWVSSSTQGMIKTLFKLSDVDPTWRLVLVNAIYFHGNWEKAFNAANTKSETFTKLDGTKVKAPLMSLQNNLFAFQEFPQIKATVLQMNYIGNDIKMTVILPDETNGLYQVLASLDVEILQSILGDLPTQMVNVKFPKFKFEAEYGKELMDTMKKDLGITDIFSYGRADFSGIATEPLYVKLIKQKGVVDVDEKGTKAAVVTGVAVGIRSSAVFVPREFIVDHPFMFIISDIRNGAIIFCGTYLTPPK